jgi:hypothetical protein
MTASELKKQLKEMRPKFASDEEEIAYHTAAKKSLAARERMAAVRAAKKSGTPAQPEKSEKSEKKAPVKAVKEEKKTEVVSAKKAALLAQLEALGSA